MAKDNRRLADATAAGLHMGGLSHWTMRLWGRTGRVSTFKIGSRLMFDLNELDRLIAESERPRLEVAK